MSKRLSLAALILSALICFSAIAELPKTLNYQGKITDPDGVAIDDPNRTIAFMLFDVSTGGAPLWAETLSVAIVKGLFDVRLGEIRPIGLSFSDKYWMQIKVDRNDDGDVVDALDELLAPRLPLSPVAYAHRAIWADSVSGVAYINFIDSVTFIDSISFIDSITYVDSIGYIDSIGWLAWADSAHWAGHVHWDSIIGVPAITDADWQISGTHLYSLVSGNVGVGDVTPDHKLDVNGNIGLSYGSYINFDDVTGTSGYGFRDNAGTLQFKNFGGSWTAFGAGGGDDGDWVVSGANIYSAVGGNVGIGTTSPGEKLVVNGRISLTGDPNSGDDAMDRDYADARYLRPEDIFPGTNIGVTTGLGTATISVSPQGPSSGLNADLLDGYHASYFSTSGHTHCDDNWNCADSGLYITSADGYALRGITADSLFAGVRGEGGTKSTGVVGVSSFGAGAGVLGSGSGTEGVYGESNCYHCSGGLFVSPDTVAWGVYGLGSDQGGAVFGVSEGFSGSWYSGTAVTGLSKNFAGVFIGDTTANSWGLFAQTFDENGIAIRARSNTNATSGYNYAVFATCSTGIRENVLDSIVALGAAVYAINYADTGTAIIGIMGSRDEITVLTGGSGLNGNGTSVGIFGHADSDDNRGYGIIGRTDDTGGIGVMGSDNGLVLPGSITDGAGVIGYSDNTGVFGWGSTAEASCGVYGISDDATGGYGMIAIGNIGIQGEGNSTSAANRGVIGYTSDYSGGIDVGVFGQSVNTTADYAGYFSGDVRVINDFWVGGSKSALLLAEDGYRAVYCQESPEIWFEDFGEGRLDKGRAKIELPKDFLSIITIDNDHPMKVFVQLTDPDCRGVAVIKGSTGFEVVELGGGTSSATFDWRVVAKRSGYEDRRYDRVPKADQLLQANPVALKEIDYSKPAPRSISAPKPTVDSKLDDGEIELKEPKRKAFEKTNLGN